MSRNNRNPPPNNKRKGPLSNATSRKKPRRDSPEDEFETFQVYPITIISEPQPQPQDDFKTPKAKAIRDKIQSSKMPEKAKEIALQRLKHLDTDKSKTIEWFDSLLSIPFGEFSQLDITKADSPSKIEGFFKSSEKILDEAVYGMDSVKEEIVNYIAQFISTNNKSTPRVLGLCGAAGVGKSQIIRNGLSKVLKRPMQCISMGGLTDSAYFTGHEYTYVGSRYGIITQALINSKVMNPIIFLDEIDKVSETKSGLEIQNFLIHITDPVQNTTFNDKYFSGIDLDLSKVIFIFAFNDQHLIHPILKDRISTIHVPEPDLEAKIVIGKKYLLKEIAPNVGFNIDDIVISEELIRTIILRFCSNDKGVRGLKRCLETILLKMNKSRYCVNKKKYKSLPDRINLPYKLTQDNVDDLLDKTKPARESILDHLYA
jgi:ATP-dependent Lon protease